MKNIKLLLLFVFFVSISTYTHAQNSKFDLAAWEEKIREHLSDHPTISIELSDSLLNIGNQLDNDEYISKGYYYLGIANYFIGRNHLSNEFYKKALKTSYADSNLDFQGKCWNNMGVNYDLMDKKIESIDAYLKSLKVCEQLNDSLGIAQSWINLGLLDTKMSNFERSEKFIKKAYNYFVGKKDTLNIALCIQNLAFNFDNKTHIDSALIYYQNSYELFEKVDYKHGMAQIAQNIGMKYIDMERKDLAKSQLLLALDLAKQIDFKSLEAKIYLNYAHFISVKPAEKLHYLQLAQNIFKEIGDDEKSLHLSLILSDIYVNIGDIKNYQLVMEEYKNRISETNLKKSKQLYEEFQAIYESEAKENIIIQQQEKLEWRKMLLIISGILIVLLIFFIYVVTYLMLKMRKYIRVLYQKNEELKNAKVRHNPIPQKVLSLEDISTNPSSEQDTRERKTNDSVVSKMSELYEEIIQLFEKEKIHLKHDITVSDLSNRLNTNDKYISVAINNNSQYNFNHLVNDFRINEAKNLIVQFGKSINIKELADKSGYKSLNTFYKNFKDNTGLTPSQYIELSEDQKNNHLASS